jgi:hypothetical protein
LNLWRGKAFVAGMLTWWACFAAPAAASQAADPAGGAGLESNPITCWWRTDRSAVHVGERFTLTLTCGVGDTAGVRVVADPDRLDPAALDLTPFEVVGGTRHKDIEAPPRRYFQYSYVLRLLGDEFFGQDVDIPSIPITYNMESSGVTGTRGRDQLYLLPPLPVRVLSLVPRAATDIQDGSPETFGDIERRMFRATGELAAAGVLFAFAAVLAGLAVVRIARPRLARVAAEPHLLTSAPILRGCIPELVRVKSETERSGWTIDLIDRSLTVFRIAGAMALGRPVAQRVVDSSVAAQEGQLRIRKGPLSAERALISGAATAATVAARLAAGNSGTMPGPPSRTPAQWGGMAGPPSRTPPPHGASVRRGDPGPERWGGMPGGMPGGMDPRMRMTLEELSESLSVFAAARYSRNGDLDAPALDAALDTGTRALRRLYAMNQWPARTADALSRAAARLRGAVWPR